MQIQCRVFPCISLLTPSALGPLHCPSLKSVKRLRPLSSHQRANDDKETAGVSQKVEGDIDDED